MVEIQYRTRAQHAWATAVEISDILDGVQTKFEMDQSDRGRFFAIASEIIARKHEGLERAFLDCSLEFLESELQELEKELRVLQRLSLIKTLGDGAVLKRHNVLNIYRDDEGKPKLEVRAFRSPTEAIKYSSDLESSEDSLNAVYVRSDNPNQLKSAYRNYFNDPIDFVRLLK